MQNAESIATRYDEVSPRYHERPETAEVILKLFWFTYEHLTWSAVERLLPTGRRWRILDAGGGGGKYGVRMAERGHPVTVLDLSPGMLEQARVRFAEAGLASDARFEVGNILALPFEDNAFDFVFCEGDPVSYCLDEYPKALAELFRVAAPGAPVVLGVDNREEHFRGALYDDENKARALEILRTGRSVCPYGLPVHAFTEPELRRAVEAAGGEVEELFGKPVLFFEVLQALQAERGPGFDLWAARGELAAIQERLAHEGYAGSGSHFQVMARRRR